ncbi:glycosyltransferase family 2 protein [Rhodopirellula sp. JC740]|uniref:Glycosyltransferase family 2 protein n=1 Tax=Rhodopirellula halodulae TaxID=2894198 RepID=A0ABS8NEH9_9BACT|nr:glycosyltransferase family 2 protein [Rhodopirellula sp. JC740]
MTFAVRDVPEIDVVILSRYESAINAAVVSALRSQVGVKLSVHRIVGAPRSTDSGRIATIVRARNKGVHCGNSALVMFLDDDVVLASDCIARLHHALLSRRDQAGVAADYLGESSSVSRSKHVAMGATLFWRSVLQQQPFRYEPGRCECLCKCEDVRRLGLRIDYVAGARAEHRKQNLPCQSHSRAVAGEEFKAKEEPPAKILVAFNRRDVARFRNGFLRTLRSCGNEEQVIAVGYGLYPSEITRLASEPNLRLISKPYNGQLPPVRRLSDFASVAAELPKQTPLAYWDAGDVLFQGKLSPLWALARSNPTKILAVREPSGYPENPAIRGWTQTISDGSMRRQVFERFATNPFLNSGFAAGSARAMRGYFEEAVRLRASSSLRGTTDWGDQTALNLFCHSDPERWAEVPQEWNYCVHDRVRGEVRISPDGIVFDRNGKVPTVVHGNARSLRQFAILR